MSLFPECCFLPCGLVKGSSGLWNVELLGTLLHSRNPHREAERFAESLPLYPCSKILIVGAGYGYAVEHFLNLQESRPDIQLALFEPLFPLLRQPLMQERYLAFKERGVNIFNFTDQIKDEVHESSDSFYDEDIEHDFEKWLQQLHGFTVMIHPVYRRMFPELEEWILSSIQKDSLHSSATKIDETTISYFAHRWFKNSLVRHLNMDSASVFSDDDSGKRGWFSSDASYQISEHAILCGGSPSLLDDIRYWEEKFTLSRISPLIISSDTSSATLIHHGLRPDWIISIDSGRGTLYHLSMMVQALAEWGEALPCGIPVLTWSAGSLYLERFFSHVYLYPSSFPLDQLLFSLPCKKRTIWDNPTRNAAGIALQLAHHLNVKHIYYAGMNFKSRHGMSHVRGTGYDLYVFEKNNRTFTRESYRPGGYRESLKGRHAVAARECEKMCADLNLIGHTPPHSRSDSSDHNSFTALRILLNQKPESGSFLPESLCKPENIVDLLRKNYSIDLLKEEIPVSPKYIRKFFRC